MKKQKKDREISKQPFGSDPLNLTQKSGLFDYDDDVCFGSVLSVLTREREAKTIQQKGDGSKKKG
jgi:hypothetical protein